MPREFEYLISEVNRKKADIHQHFRGVIVGCSGGPDSTALFHLLCTFAKGLNSFPVGVAHVAYGLRGEDSEKDFRFCENLAREAEAPVFTRRAGVAPPTGIQAWARDVRRAFFAELAGDGWLVALAHHQDDVAETALFRLARGASISHLAGMTVWDPPYWRPLLHERKADLLTYLAREKRPFRIDSSNARNDYARNVIRNRVLKDLEGLFPGAAARIAETALEGQALMNGASNAPEGDPVAAARLAAGNWLSARLPRGAQLSRRLLQSLPGGHALVQPAGDLAKAPREAQHRMGLKAFEVQALLEPCSHAALTGQGRGWRLMAKPQDNSVSSAVIRPGTVRVFGIGAQTPLRFSCTPPQSVSREWTLKQLSRRWRVPHDAREEYLAIEYNQELIGLFDGENVVKPSPDGGQKRRVDTEIFDTFRELPHG
jgi:tRNA(Ile)-lysidine synthetase-like protein